MLDAVNSLLEQSYDGGLRIILVNDGCPFEETDRVCKDYSRAYPDRITYLRKRNGGLSDARNFGISHVLSRYPSVEAIYMLDADNRLRPEAIAKAMRSLTADPEIDWIYPSIDMFGLEARSDFGGDFSLLIQSDSNLCDAGSLIHRRVFEAGMTYDTSFKKGWEDWDFFLSAARLGFRGKNEECMGFEYRKRPESMLADALRGQETLRETLETKHAWLYTPRALMELEQVEAPRFAIHMTQNAQVLCCVDPEAPSNRPIAFEEFEAQYWRAKTYKCRHRTPPFNLAMTRESLQALKDLGLLHWALWRLEMLLDTNPLVVLTVSENTDARLAVASYDSTPISDLPHDAVAVACKAKFLDGMLLGDPQDGRGIKERFFEETAPVLHVSVPAGTDILAAAQQGDPVTDMSMVVHRLRRSPYRDAAAVTWDMRGPGIRDRSREHQIVRRHAGRAPLFPRVQDPRRHIGCILPLVEFGGVEKVALNMARALKAQGWTLHAFVLHADDIAFSDDWQTVFETTTVMFEDSFTLWDGNEESYFGTDIPDWARQGWHGSAIGMMHWLDVVINFHGGSIAGAMGKLRSLGIVTVNSLHLIDETRFGQGVGNTYLGLAYEYAFDLFAPCSQQLGHWLRGMGVPDHKIMPVVNAPGFAIDQAHLDSVAQSRAQHDADRPLNILFMGRLDPQKGLARLSDVMRATQDRQLNVAWRIVGKSVLADGAPLPGPVDAVLEPPISGSDALSEAYAWADVFVLMSDYEGLPLTVLEAMRAGAVVIATDVGATGEAVKHDANGILVDLPHAVSQTVAAIEKLCGDRSALRAMSQQAMADMLGRDWSDATEALSVRLQDLVPVKTGPSDAV